MGKTLSSWLLRYWLEHSCFFNFKLFYHLTTRHSWNKENLPYNRTLNNNRHKFIILPRLKLIYVGWKFALFTPIFLFYKLQWSTKFKLFCSQVFDIKIIFIEITKITYTYTIIIYCTIHSVSLLVGTLYLQQYSAVIN